MRATEPEVVLRVILSRLGDDYPPEEIVSLLLRCPAELVWYLERLASRPTPAQEALDGAEAGWRTADTAKAVCDDVAPLRSGPPLVTDEDGLVAAVLKARR